MKSFLSIFTSVLVLSIAFVGSQNVQSKGLKLTDGNYSIKTSKGTRKFNKVDYNKIPHKTQMPITNHRSSSIGSRGSRLDLDKLPPTSSGSINSKSSRNPRGTR